MKLKVAIFSHSLVSDWNHGNAHFLRGIVAELQDRGHTVRVFEPQNSWSRSNLLADHGVRAIDEFAQAFPDLRSQVYDQPSFDDWLGETDLALVHEWNNPSFVEAIGRYRKNHGHLRLFFHDTHHRAITAPEEMARFDLSAFDGVLVYGESLKQAYQRLGWGRQVHVWHEAADVRVFHPLPSEASTGRDSAPPSERGTSADLGRAHSRFGALCAISREGESVVLRSSSKEKRGDLVWIGNWGDDERTAELREFFVEPSRDLSLRTEAFGVRYPPAAREELAAAGITYRGWLANYKVPKAFAKFAATIHVPRRPYARQLTGIPTIRPFEALACGIPLVSAPWRDDEGLFRVGTDFLMANNGAQMREHLRSVLNDNDLARSLVQHGLETILGRHTCSHRVNELLAIYECHATPILTGNEVYQ